MKNTAWVCEQVSNDHTVLPTLDEHHHGGPAADTGSPSPAIDRSKGESDSSFETEGLAKKGAIAVAGVCMAVGGSLFGLPIISSFLESEPAQLAFVASDPAAEPTQRFVIEGNTLYLEGTVPNVEVSSSIEGAAKGALGDDRVVNNFAVDSGAVYSVDAHVPLTVAETVLFSTGRADIGTQYETLIDLGVDLMMSEEQVELTVIGHTDDVGEQETNAQLSLQRAQATADEFVRRGIDVERLGVEGRGESEPIASNETDEGRRTNRRVEFLITGLNG